jgi:hypothetical protein
MIVLKQRQHDENELQIEFASAVFGKLLTLVR